MSSFSFDGTAGASQSSSKSKLAGNEIHIVKFDDCEIKDITGVQDPSKTFKNLILKFSNKDGYFEHTVWEPKSTDFQRPEPKEYNGNKIQSPSNVETMNLIFKHAFDTISPAIAKQIDEGKKLSAKDWDELRKLVKQILDKGKGTELALKLGKNNKGEAVIPSFPTSISKEGKVYISNNFIAPVEDGKHKLFFSAKEVARMTNEKTAKPASIDSQTSLGSEDLGGDSLDLNLEL